MPPHAKSNQDGPGVHHKYVEQALLVGSQGMIEMISNDQVLKGLRGSSNQHEVEKLLNEKTRNRKRMSLRDELPRSFTMDRKRKVELTSPLDGRK